MKIILNTALSPYFIATDIGNGWELSTWDSNRLSSEVIWNHLNRFEISTRNKIIFLGVSGPGSFTNLRLCGVLAETLRFKEQAVITAISTAELACIALNVEKGFIPAYSDYVFVVGMEEKELKTRSEILESAEGLDFINQTFKPENWNEKILNRLWDKKKIVERFHPDYFFPAVQD